ncbi:hypothetical protein Poly41_21220 [Novipirellula artificiosorum]|uniref:Uncharacterized protein n=1 Tax=Novipirellula artificiosorum TaxID=2528016 RepID=A0A5C6DRA9_9BACT|nr:hypothetical protein Poly41_21220 [Novipirellula artificiosorum]
MLIFAPLLAVCLPLEPSLAKKPTKPDPPEPPTSPVQCSFQLLELPWRWQSKRGPVWQPKRAPPEWW